MSILVRFVSARAFATRSPRCPPDPSKCHILLTAFRCQIPVAAWSGFTCTCRLVGASAYSTSLGHDNGRTERLAGG
jgi:hypothetical protein